jgi:hypothetical protein
MQANDGSSLTIIDRALDAEGWSAEVVLLRRDADGGLTLLARNHGRAVQLQIGEDVVEYERRWTVGPADVGGLLAGWLGERFQDGDAFERWLDGQGIDHAASAWQGHGGTRLDQTELTLAAGRDIVGQPRDSDEGSTVASRFLGWLITHEIPYLSEEQLTR